MFKKGLANDAARSDIAVRVAERMNKKAQASEFQIPIAYEYYDEDENEYIAHILVDFGVGLGGFGGISDIQYFEDANGNRVEMPDGWDIGDQGPIAAEVAAEQYPDLNMAAYKSDEQKITQLLSSMGIVKQTS